MSSEDVGILRGAFPDSIEEIKDVIAIELLRRELAVNPGSGRANATLAVCLAHSGRHKEAQERMQMALRLEPENPARMFQAGRVANLTGNPIDAVEWFRRANAAGYGRFELPRDPELAPIRNNPAYKAAFGKLPATG